MKKRLRLTIAIKGGEEGKNPLPVFMEGEDPGVFSIVEYELDVAENELQSAMFAKWMMDKERDMIEDSIKLQWQEEVQVDEDDV